MSASLALLGVLAVTAAAQISYKAYSLSRRARMLVVTIALFAMAPPLTYLAVKSLGVGLVYITTAVTHVVVVLAGWRLFGERIDRRSIAAMSMITLGILIYGLGLP